MIRSFFALVFLMQRHGVVAANRQFNSSTIDIKKGALSAPINQEKLQHLV